MKAMTLLAVSLFASGAFGQALKNVPPLRGMYISSDGSGNPGTWVPESGTGTSVLPNRVPDPVGAYCSNDGTGNPGTWVPCSSSSGGVTTVGNSDGTLTISPTSGTVTASLNLAHSNTWTANGALSAPAALWNGTPVITGGTGTTTWPLVLLQPNGTTTTAWNTAGTMFGINAASGFSGNLFDFQENGSSKLNLSSGGTLSGVTFTASAFHTFTNCSNSASPAVCGSAASGSVAVAASASTVQVNTTAVTANSQILLTFDSSLSTRLAVTCTTTIAQPTVSLRTAGSNFTITLSAAASGSPACISYTIIN